MSHYFELKREKTYLIVSGSLDAEEALLLRPKLDEFIEDSESNLLVNLSNVSFMDSSGIGMIVYVYKRLMAENRELTLGGVNGQPLELIKMLRVDKAIPMAGAKGEVA